MIDEHTAKGVKLFKEWSELPHQDEAVYNQLLQDYFTDEIFNNIQNKTRYSLEECFTKALSKLNHNEEVLFEVYAANRGWS